MAGNDKVEVRGGGDFDGAVFQNAASEATLKELVRVLSTKGGKASGDEAMRLHKKTIDENIVAIDRVTNRQDVYNKLLKDSNDKVKTFGNELASATSKIVGGVFSTTISLAASGLQTLIGFLTNSVDQFRDLSSTGASFNNNMIEMRRAAASANMSMDEFTKVIKNGSTYLGGFGGTITEGAKRFGEISKSLRSGNIGEELFSMGYSVNEINSGLGSYIELQTKLGRSEIRDQKAMVAGSAEYLKQLDLLAKVTGQSREELAKSMEAQTRDLQLSSIASKLRGQELEDFRATVAAMDKTLSKDMADGIKDLMDGRPDTAMGRAVAQMAPGLAEYAKQVAKDGGGGLLGFQKAMADAIPAIEDYQARYGDIAGALKASGNEDIKARVSFIENIGNMRTIAGQNVKTMQEEQGRRHALTTGMNSLENSFNLIKNTIIDKLLGSKIFEKLESAMGKIITQFTQPGGFAEKIASFVDNLISGFDSDLTQKGLVSAISGLFAKVAPILGDLAKGAMRMIVEGFTGAGEKRAALETKRSQLTEAAGYSNLGTNDPAIKGQLAKVNEELAKMDAASPFEGLMSGLGSFIGGLFDLKTILIGGGAIIGGIVALNVALGSLSGGVALLANPASLVGIGALTVAIMGIGKGLEFASPAITAFATLIEKAFGGISGVINSMVDGFKSIPLVFKELGEIDGSNLKNVASAVASMAAALAGLAGGGILALISGNSVNDLAKSLNTFNNVDSTNLRNVVNAIGEIRTTIGSDFSNQAAGIDSFRTSITNLNKELKVLADRLDKLPKQGGGVFDSIKNAVGLGGPSTTSGSTPVPISSGSSSMEELNKSMMQLITIAKELNETNKDQLKFLKEKPGQAV